ncbi:MAG: hypothetical protein OIF55_06365 [Amphritea sp.]|nr:hypothetical protein [Amphritea sp.]
MDKQLEQQINHWQDTISDGNRFFTLRRYGDAMRLYEQARQLATGLFSQWQDTEAAIATVVISYHNQADLYLHINLATEALETLHQAHTFVLKTLDQAQKTEPENDARIQQLLQAANRTYFAIMRHQQRYPSDAQDTLIPAPPSLGAGHTITMQ